MTEDEVRELELTVLALAHQLAAFPSELETALRQGQGMQLLPQLVSVARNARLTATQRAEGVDPQSYAGLSAAAMARLSRVYTFDALTERQEMALTLAELNFLSSRLQTRAAARATLTAEGQPADATRTASTTAAASSATPAAGPEQPGLRRALEAAPTSWTPAMRSRTPDLRTLQAAGVQLTTAPTPEGAATSASAPHGANKATTDELDEAQAPLWPSLEQSKGARERSTSRGIWTQDAPPPGRPRSRGAPSPSPGATLRATSPSSSTLPQVLTESQRDLGYVLHEGRVLDWGRLPPYVLLNVGDHLQDMPSTLRRAPDGQIIDATPGKGPRAKAQWLHILESYAVPQDWTRLDGTKWEGVERLKLLEVLRRRDGNRVPILLKMPPPLESSGEGRPLGEENSLIEISWASVRHELWPLGAFSKDSPLQRRYEELRATKGYGKGKVTEATDLVWLERATYTEVLEVHCGTARGQQLVAKIPETGCYEVSPANANFGLGRWETTGYVFRCIARCEGCYRNFCNRRMWFAIDFHSRHRCDHCRRGGRGQAISG